MKIVNVDVIVLGDPPPKSQDAAFSLPAAASWSVYIKELAFVRIQTDEGITGCSEVFSVPADVVKVVLNGSESYLGRHLIGQDPIPPERLWTHLYNAVLPSNRRGWQMICIGAIDVALWDIFGKALERPVYELLGGAERASHQIQDKIQERRQIVPYCTIISRSWDAASVLSQQIEYLNVLAAKGYRAMKIEPMRSTSDTIIELVKRAREALGPKGALMVDVGYLWSDVGSALRVLRSLEEYDLFFVETPFPVDCLNAYAKLAPRTPLRIAAGEHSVTRWEFLDLMDRGGVTVVQPYVVTAGGLTEAKRILELAVPRGVLVIPGNWSTQFQGAAAVQFATMSPISPMIEFAPAELYDTPLRRAIQEIGHPVNDGLISPPSAPGNGVELTEDLIRHFRIA